MSADFLNDLENTAVYRLGKRGLLHILFSPTVVILLALLMEIALLFLLLSPFFEYVSLLMGGVTVLTVCMLIHILNTDANPSVKLSWCVIIAALPLFGNILYFWLRFDIGNRLVSHMFRQAAESSAACCPDTDDRLEQLRQEDPNLHNLALYLRRHGGHRIYGNTAVTCSSSSANYLSQK